MINDKRRQTIILIGGLVCLTGGGCATFPLRPCYDSIKLDADLSITVAVPQEAKTHTSGTTRNYELVTHKDNLNGIELIKIRTDPDGIVLAKYYYCDMEFPDLWLMFHNQKCVVYEMSLRKLGEIKGAEKPRKDISTGISWLDPISSICRDFGNEARVDDLLDQIRQRGDFDHEPYDYQDTIDVKIFPALTRADRKVSKTGEKILISISTDQQVSLLYWTLGGWGSMATGDFPD